MAQNAAPVGIPSTPSAQVQHEPMELGEARSNSMNKQASEMVHHTPRTSRRDNFKRGNSRERSHERHFTRTSTPSRVASIERQPKCNFCQKPGHVLKNCHEKLKQENRCFKCHKVGHKTDTCWSKNHLEGSSQQENFQRTRYFNRGRENFSQTRKRGEGVNERRKQGQTEAQFNREGLNRQRHTAADNGQLLNDIKDFFSVKEDTNKQSTQ